MYDYCHDDFMITCSEWAITSIIIGVSVYEITLENTIRYGWFILVIIISISNVQFLKVMLSYYYYNLYISRVGVVYKHWNPAENLILIYACFTRSIALYNSLEVLILS